MKRLKKLAYGNVILTSIFCVGSMAVIFLGCLSILFFTDSDDGGVTVSAYIISMIIAIGILVFIFGIFGLILWLSSYFIYKKQLDVLLSIPGFNRERFEREIEHAPKMKNVLASSDAICFLRNTPFAGSSLRVIPIQEIVWVCENKDASFDIYTVKKEVMTIRPLKRDTRNIKYLLRLIARKQQGIIVGYDVNLDRMFKQDFQRFMQITASRIQTVRSDWLEQQYIQNGYYVKDFNY